jgi:hypothetical protein
MRVAVSISLEVAPLAIDQLVSMLSIPKIQNLARNIREFEPESVLIIISCRFSISKKREINCRLYTSIE